uniref:Uncharacterized protein n=1 Tax=Meloidogyne hapla TaxID=6305 RepID=A0A1I8BSL2_MELHA
MLIGHPPFQNVMNVCAGKIRIPSYISKVTPSLFILRMSFFDRELPPTGSKTSLKARTTVLTRMAHPASD